MDILPVNIVSSLEPHTLPKAATPTWTVLSFCLKSKGPKSKITKKNYIFTTIKKNFIFKNLTDVWTYKLRSIQTNTSYNF